MYNKDKIVQWIDISNPTPAILFNIMELIEEQNKKIDTLILKLENNVKTETIKTIPNGRGKK